MAIQITKETSAQKINQSIRQQTEHNIVYYAAHINEIDSRLEELDQEWDIERAIEANTAVISIASLALGILGSRKWLFLPVVVGGFLMQHAVQGWCPPLPLLRKLGIRTQTEIERERYALKALRGDFNRICNSSKNEMTNLSQNIIEALDE